MARIIFILYCVLTSCNSFGQTKDLVFGNPTIQEIADRIHFKKLGSPFLRFDNAGHGESFAIVISTDSVAKIDDYRITECMVVDENTMTSLLSTAKRFNTGYQLRPTISAGTFRIVSVNDEESFLFYFMNCRSSLEFFDQLTEDVPNAEKNLALNTLTHRIASFLKSLEQCK